MTKEFQLQIACISMYTYLIELHNNSGYIDKWKEKIENDTFRQKADKKNMKIQMLNSLTLTVSELLE